MLVVKSILLFLLAAVAEIGGAWLVWQGVREHKGWVWVGAGVIALGLYGFVATLQPDAHFGRILAAYGGVFVAGSLIWRMVADGFRPDRRDVAGALICLVGVALIMYAPGQRSDDPTPAAARPPGRGLRWWLRSGHRETATGRPDWILGSAYRLFSLSGGRGRWRVGRTGCRSR